jgi:hypothetical protein
MVQTHRCAIPRLLLDRLEFLGDAVLDFLVIRCIFVNHYETVKPSKIRTFTDCCGSKYVSGHVTDIRQDLANNGRLAYILGCCGLHKNILHASTYLFDQINSYCKDDSIFPPNLTSKETLKKVKINFETISASDCLGHRSMG